MIKSKTSKIALISIFILGIIAVVFLILILPKIKSQGEQQKINLIENGTFEYTYGYSDGVMTNYDSLSYTVNSNGVITIKKDKGILGYMGFALTGTVGGNNYIYTSENFTWIWTHSQQGEEHIFTAYNNNLNFNWTQIYHFYPNQPMKISHIITNNLANITNAKMWYVHTIEDNDRFVFNNTIYNLNPSQDKHFQGNFNNILSIVKIQNKYFFNYSDIIANNFDITDVFIGNGSLVNHPEKYIMAVGFTKGSGSFLKNTKIEIDPNIVAVDTTNDVGNFPAIGLDSTGVVHIVAFDDTNDQARYCNNSGGSWSCANVDGSTGYTSLAIDSNNKVHIVHEGGTTQLTYCNNTIGVEWSCVEINAILAGGGRNSIALDTNNKVHIVYSTAGTPNNVSYCNNTVSSIWSCQDFSAKAAPTGSTFTSSSIALDSNNKAHIVGHDSSDTFYCNNTVGGVWSCDGGVGGPFPAGADSGYGAGIAIDSKGVIHIASYWFTGAPNYRLLYSSNPGGVWTNQSIFMIGTDPTAGSEPAIAIDIYNKSHILFINMTADNLYYCNNTGVWGCEFVNNTDIDDVGERRITDRSLVIKKGRIVDSTSFSTAAHFVWSSGSDDLYYSNITLPIPIEGDTTAPFTFLKSPPNATITQDLTIYFAANFTDETALKNTTLFIYNSTKNIINRTENYTLTGTADIANLSVRLPYNGTFYWNYQVCDLSNNCAFNNTENWTLSLETNPITNCISITQSGRYVMAKDIINTAISYCIDIQADNVTFDCQGHLIDGNDVADYGIYITRATQRSTNITISNCRLRDWDTYAIYNRMASGNTFSNITAISNPYDSISLQYSNYNNLTNINATGGEYGLNLYVSYYNTIKNSKFSNFGSAGIISNDGIYNNFINLSINNNYHGIQIFGYNSRQNIITNSTIKANSKYGIVLTYTKTSTIYNNLINNSPNYNFYLYSTGFNNAWNTTKIAVTNIVGGANIGGNYWTNPTGTGFSDTCVDSDVDGICDSAYTLNSYNKDYLPLARVIAGGDTTIPYVNIYSPINNTFQNGNVTIRVTATDNLAVKNVTTYYKNSTNSGVLCSNATTPYICIWNTVTFNSGTEGYDINATAYDTSNNKNSSIRHYTIDKNAPLTKDLTTTYPSGQTSARNRQIIILSVNLTDSTGSGLNITKTDLTNLNTSFNMSMIKQAGLLRGEWSYWNRSVNISGLTGFDMSRLYVIDNVSNMRDGDVFGVQIDNDAGTWNSLSAPSSEYNNTAVSFQVNLYDNWDLDRYIFGSNITGSWINDSVSISGTGYSPLVSKTPVLEGNWTYQFYFYDDAGNKNETDYGTIEILGNAPSFTVYLWNPDDGAKLNYNKVDMNFSYEEGEDNVAKNCSLWLNGSLYLTLDNPANYTILNFTDTLPDDDYNWYVECVENVTEVLYSSSTRTFTVDTTKPITIITYPANTTYNYNVNKLNYTYTEPNCDKVWYSNDTGRTNSTPTTCGTNFTNIFNLEGSNTWTVYMNDTAGNENTSSIMFVQDTTKPIITIYMPQNSTYNNQSTLINFTADSYENLWFYNGTLNTTYTQELQQNHSDGQYTFIFYANDSASNKNSTSLTFFIDTIKPILAITYPANTTYNYDVNKLNYTYTEANLDVCWYHNITGINSSFATLGANFTNVMSVEGSNTYTVFCNDTASNENSTSIMFTKITVDTINPLVTIKSPTATTYTSSIIPIEITLNESGTCEYSVSKGIINFTMTANSTNTGFTSTATLNNGYYTFNAYCNDTAGNINNTETLSFSVDIGGVGGGVGGGGGGISIAGKKKICSIIYWFLLNNKLNYTDKDVLDLVMEIKNKTNFYISLKQVEDYIYYFDYYCNEFNMTKPRPLAIVEPNITYIYLSSRENCSVYLNTSIVGFNLDWSTLYPKFFWGNMTCKQVNFWRWIFNIEEVGDNTYNIRGIKLFWFALLILVGIFYYMFVYKVKKQKRIVKKLIENINK